MLSLQHIKSNRKRAPAKAKSKQHTWTCGLPAYVVKQEKELNEQEKREQFIILCRAPKDPVCSAEQKRSKNLPKASGNPLGWKNINQTSLEAWIEAIYDHLEDLEPRTFNRIMVELVDKTADICAGKNPEWALWNLVGDGLVEHTGAMPLLFRRKT